MSSPWVLLHGFLGAPSSFDALVEHLPEGRRVVRPIFVGHRGAPSEATRWDAEVARIADAILREAGPGAHLVGYSMGARVALSLLARHPELECEGATLVGGRLPPHGAEREARRARDEDLAKRLETESLEAFVDDWEALPLFSTQRALPEALREKRRRERLMHDPRGLAACLRTLGLACMPDLRDELGDVLVPVTLAVGERDEAFLDHAEELLAHLPRARLVTFEGAGHDLTLERPAELAAILTEDEA